MRTNTRSAIVVLLGLLLTGCGYGIPVDNRSMVVALAVGLKPHRLYHVSTEVLDPSGGASSSSGAGGSANPISVFSGQSRHLSGAFGQMQAASPGPLDLGNVTTILFSERLVRQQGLSVPATYLSSFGVARLAAWTGVVQGSAGAVIASSLATTAMTADRQVYLTQTFVSTAHPTIYTMPLWALYRDLHNPEQGLVLPLISLQHHQLIYIGSALFDKGRMTGTLTPQETALLTTITTKRPGMRLNLNLNGHPIAVKFTSVRSSVHMASGPHAILSLHVSAMPVIGPTPLTQTASEQRQLETLTSNKLAHDIVTLYKVLQNAHCDGLNLGLYLRTSNPTIWAREKGSWPAGMRHLPLSVHVRVSLSTPGT